MEPKQASILATVRKDSFDLEPVSSTGGCSTVSVAAHTLYEKTRPDILHGPGGVLLLDKAQYEQINPRMVRVRGSVFETRPYQVKLEGAMITGFRSVFIGGIRDAILIAQIDVSLAPVFARLKFLTTGAENARPGRKLCSYQ